MKKTPMNNEYTIELTQFRSNYAKICDTSILAFASEKKATDVCLLQIILTFLLIASYSNLIFQIKKQIFLLLWISPKFCIICSICSQLNVVFVIFLFLSLYRRDCVWVSMNVYLCKIEAIIKCRNRKKRTFTTTTKIHMLVNKRATPFFMII